MKNLARQVGDGRTQDSEDHLRGPERLKANAARSLAVVYMLDATVIDSALYENYRDPVTANGFPLLHQNNHRAKVGCASITAAIFLAEHEPDSSNSRAVAYEDPAAWAVYGFELLERILEYSHLTEDGVYSEGPFYFRYTSQNLLPMARAWEGWLKGASWPVAEDTMRVSPWQDPRIAKAYRWMLDVMLPDGSLAPYDDGNVGRRHYYGLAPTVDGDPSEMYWAWGLNRESQYLAAPFPFPTDGNIELAPDAIFSFDDSVAPRRPEGAPTRIYEEGGVTVLRSGWDQNDVVAVVLDEYDVAASFGRGPQGDPVFPDSHEHADPASFMLSGYGERLMLDPGYLEFWRRFDVNRPQDRNMILVDGRGPVDCLDASNNWGAFTPNLPPPADGIAYLSDSFDATRADGVTVITQYGAGEYGAPGGAEIERRFVFASDPYLVIADRARSSEPGAMHTFTWRFHGNGGGEAIDGDLPNLGTFERSEEEARWHRTGASVLTAAVSADGPMTYSKATSFHEPGGRDENGDVARSSRTAWEASRAGSDVAVLSIVYPYPRTGDGPQVHAGEAGIDLLEGAWRAEARIQSDRTLLLVETIDGTETLRYAERMQRESGLMQHAYGLPLADNDVHWLRGNSWVTASPSDYLRVRVRTGETDPGVEQVLRDQVRGVMELQDSETGLWWTVMDRAGEIYLETSGSALFAYGIARAYRYGILGEDELASARRAVEGVKQQIRTAAHRRPWLCF